MNSLTDIVDRVGVELEGGWDSSEHHNCKHDCDYDCQTHSCDHECNEDIDCWYEICDTEDCDHDDSEPWDYPNCFKRKCDHECGDRCYVDDCCHECDEDCFDVDVDGFHHDGSVNVSGYVSGEVASQPHYNLEELKTWIEFNGPQKVNKTCGTHVHLSLLNKLDYDLLIDTEKEFYNYFIAQIETWGRAHLSEENEFWSRFNGNNDYCCRNDRPYCTHGENAHSAFKQVKNTGKMSARYAHVNFCRDLHGTIEFRIFHGMKTPSLIISAVQAVVDIVDSYISMRLSLYDDIAA